MYIWLITLLQMALGSESSLPHVQPVPDAKLIAIDDSWHDSQVAIVLATLYSAGVENLSSNYLDNEAVFCMWNEWESRDQRARIECTFDGGRFSHAKKGFLGITNGRWYCAYKQEAYKALGHTPRC